jgi:hypothetical protein
VQPAYRCILITCAQQAEELEGKEDFEPELSFQTDGGDGKPMGGTGTQTLAQRLSQSLRDPLRSKDYLGTYDKGEITIDCHHHSKVIMFKNRKGYLSTNAMENLTGLYPYRAHTDQMRHTKLFTHLCCWHVCPCCMIPSKSRALSQR